MYKVPPPPSKSVWEEYQVEKRDLEYHGCREEYNRENIILRLFGRISSGCAKGEGDGDFGGENKDKKNETEKNILFSMNSMKVYNIGGREVGQTI